MQPTVTPISESPAGRFAWPPRARKVVAHLWHAGGTLLALLSARACRRDGQTMAEYGILIGVIALVVIIAAVLLGSSISALFSGTSGKV